MYRALLLVVLLACGKGNTNVQPAEAWGVDDYARVGMQTDKPWTTAEHVQAAAVLAKETAGHRERLPRFQGAKSGAVFAMLVAPLPSDENQPIAARFGAHVQRYEATNAISKLYIVNALAVPAREWIEVMGALLREAVILATDAEPFMASLGPDDPKRDVRLQGLANMKQGFGGMIEGGLLVAGDLRVPEGDRVAMVDYVTTALPALFPKLEADQQLRIRTQISALAEKLAPGKVRDAVGRAREIVDLPR